MYKKYFLTPLVALSIVASAMNIASCGGSDDPGENPPSQSFTISISVPQSLEVFTGQEVSVKVYSNLGPKASDQVVLKTSSAEYVMPIKAVGSDYFTFVMADNVPSGTYTFCIRRGNVTKELGRIELDVKQTINVEPREGYNVYGAVISKGKGVRDVVVSDGVNFTTTDDKGVYYLKSGEKYSLVYITVPSGYEAEQKGVVPQFFRNLDGNTATTERADFMLTPVANQDQHTMLFFGDMHLAKRNNDQGQFQVFVDEVNNYLKANPSRNIYAQTLGDMTWDLYWYSNNMTPSDYLNKVNRDFESTKLPIYHCMGNHDHEMGSQSTGFPIGDFNCEVAYRKVLGPNFYSYNVGKVHYVVIDDIDCTNDGTGSRTYNANVISDQLQWLAADLSYVSKSTPVVIITHAPIYNYNGKKALDNYDALMSCLQGYKTYFITGHTHDMYNTDKMMTDGHMELNSGSICATWWWTGKDTPGLFLARDGSNGGYRVWEVNGTDIKWYYKSTAKDRNVQFRTYDGNQVNIPTTNFTEKIGKLPAPWNATQSDNYIYIEVWDYDPQWTISVTENGKDLPATRMTLYDPLHYLAYEGKGHDTNAFLTMPTPNMFRVKASAPNTTVEIKVTDRFGRVYTERMARPRPFNLNEYTNNQ